MISILCLLLLSFSCYFCDDRVKYAAVLWRHGDRTPVDLYPLDPYRNESLWPVKFGELTNTGKMQHYLLGKWLRKRYSHLVSDSFDPTEIYVRSTDVDRTLMSAQANLAGFYPPIDKAIWNRDLLWQPIPIHTSPEKEDEVLSMFKPCPAFDQEYKKMINSESYKQRLKKYKKLMDYVSEHTGEKIRGYEGINSVYNVLKIEKLYNFTLPEWTKSVFPDQMFEPACYSFRLRTMNLNLARLQIGPLMKEITDHMASAIIASINAKAGKKEKPLKLSIYSGHDMTVGNVLNGLGMYDGRCPQYTSTVFFEILEADDKMPPQYYVRISYRNTTEIVEPYVLNIPRCGELCPFDRFVKLYENIININWERDCGFQYPPFALSLVIGLILFGLIYVAHKVHFARVSRHYRMISLPQTDVHNSPLVQSSVA